MLAACECGTQVSVAGGNSYDLNSNVGDGPHRCPIETDPALVGAEIKMEIRTQGGWHRYVAVFATEDQAIGFYESHIKTASMSEMESAPVSEHYTRLLAILYPKCHHGMSVFLCYGPQHYASDEEIAKGY